MKLMADVKNCDPIPSPVGRGDISQVDENIMVALNRTSRLKPRFLMGRVVATPGALAALELANQSADEFLHRHQGGDWGDVDESDRQFNEIAIEEGNRILSAYVLRTGDRIWIVTESDCRSTCVLLPSDY